jgi:hypothetical protein
MTRVTPMVNSRTSFSVTSRFFSFEHKDRQDKLILLTQRGLLRGQPDKSFKSKRITHSRAAGANKQKKRLHQDEKEGNRKREEKPEDIL